MQTGSEKEQNRKMNTKRKLTAITLAAAISVSCAALSGCAGTGASTTDQTTAASTEETPSTSEIDLSSVVFKDLADNDVIPISEFVYDDYLKYLKVTDFSNLEISESKVTYQYEQYIANMLESLQTYTELGEDEPAQNGDFVTIYYTGESAEGETFSDETMAGMTNEGDSSGYSLELGSYTFVGEYDDQINPERSAKGFEEQLIGAKTGETVTVTVRFSPIYSVKELRDKLVNFTVRIVKIERPDEAPVLSDKTVSTYTSGDYTDVESFKDYLILSYKEQLAYSAILEMIEIESYPQDALDEQIAEYKQSYYDYYEKTEEDLTADELAELEEDAEENAKEYIGERLIWNYLFGVYNITLTKAEFIATCYDNYNNYSDYYSYYYSIEDVGDFVEVFEENNLLSQFMQQKMLPVMVEAVNWVTETADTTPATTDAAETTPETTEAVETEAAETAPSTAETND
jgi:trigger factor